MSENWQFWRFSSCFGGKKNHISLQNMDLWVIFMRNSYVFVVFYSIWGSQTIPNIYFFVPEKPTVRPFLAMSKIAQIICPKKMLLKKFYSNQSQTESHYSTYIWAHCDSIWGQLEQNCGCNIFFGQIPYFLPVFAPSCTFFALKFLKFVENS